MKDLVVEWVDALARIRLEGDLDPERIAALVAERQSLLTKIQQSDTGALDPETRRELHERMRRIADRDKRLLAKLLEHRKSLDSRRDTLVHARTAVRGYRGPESEPPRGPGRVA